MGWHARIGSPPTKFHSGMSTFNIQSHVHRRKIWSDHLHVSILNGKEIHLTIRPGRHIMWRARLGEPIEDSVHDWRTDAGISGNNKKVFFSSHH